MTNIIDKIRVSGTDYTLSATSSGGNPTVELTQAEYDALVSAGTVASDTYYIITDAQAGDLTQYWTSAQTNSAITQATSGKVDSSSVVTAVTSASTDSEIPTAKAVWDVSSQGGGGGGITSGEVQTMIDASLSGVTERLGEDEEVTARALNGLYDSLSGKADSDDVYTTGQTSGATELATAFAATQPKLSAGTGISIDANNVISATGGGGGGTSYSAGSGINIDSANTITAIYNGWYGERVQELADISTPFYMFKADDCGGDTFLVSFYINYVQSVVQFDVTTHTYTLIDGDSSWEDYVTVEYDASGCFKATPNTTINVSDASCARFSKLFYSGTTENAIDGALDRIESIKNSAIGNVEFAARDIYNDLYIYPITLNGQYINMYTVGLEGGLKVIGSNIGTQMQSSDYKWMSGVTIWACETSEFAVPSSSVTFNMSRNPSDWLNIGDADGNYYSIIDSSGNPYYTEYYTTVIDNGYVTITALSTDKYIKLLGDNSCELDQYVSNVQYWGCEVDTIPNVVLGKQDKLSAGTGISISGNVISATGGGSITIDPSLDTGSTNAVANSAITNAINEKADKSTAGGGLTVSITNNHEIVNLTNQNGVSITGYWNEIGFARINNRAIANQGRSSYENFSLVETSAITTTITSSLTDSQVPSAKAVNDKLGGLSLVKLTQSEYDALSPNYDSNTLYIIVN